MLKFRHPRPLEKTMRRTLPASAFPRPETDSEASGYHKRQDHSHEGPMVTPSISVHNGFFAGSGRVKIRAGTPGRWWLFRIPLPHEPGHAVPRGRIGWENQPIGKVCERRRVDRRPTRQLSFTRRPEFRRIRLPSKPPRLHPQRIRLRRETWRQDPQPLGMEREAPQLEFRRFRSSRE